MKLILGDSKIKLKELPDNSVDSIVTDPPYGISFMSKSWDYDVPSVEIWEECLRVLKPGGHLLSFAGSRTYHRMAVRIEDAGFEIRDQIMWIYGSGFPKSHNIGKAVDTILGNEREDVGLHERQNYKKGGAGFRQLGDDEIKTDYRLTKGNSEWEGWGTALKPAHEPIVMARKPFKGSVADNVLKYGTGGINIDDSRIGNQERTYDLKGGENLNKLSRQGKGDNDDATSMGAYGHGAKQISIGTKTVEGRFPANIILDEEAGRLLDEQTGQLTSGFMKSGTPRQMSENPNVNTYGHWDSDTVRNDTYGDSGGASRFFYCPKTSKTDRNEGLDSFDEKFAPKGNNIGRDLTNTKTHLGGMQSTKAKNHHPTVKPTDLMLYLIRLVTPKNGTTLDPFMGSGSTGKAAIRGKFDFIGIEMEKEYMEIAEARIQYEIDNPYVEELEKRISKETLDTANKFFDL
jgi:site-specific DNA-methyltransferase (adenine-specific)